MKLFTTLVVFDRPEGGHYTKVTYPFRAEGMSVDTLIEKMLHYTPSAHVLVIPQLNKGIYDVAKKGFRNDQQVGVARLTGPPLEYDQNWQAFIDNFETWLLNQQTHLGASCGYKRRKQSQVLGVLSPGGPNVFSRNNNQTIQAGPHGTHFTLLSSGYEYGEGDHLLTMGSRQELHVVEKSKPLNFTDTMSVVMSATGWDMKKQTYQTRVQLVTMPGPGMWARFEPGDSVFLYDVDAVHNELHGRNA